MPVLQHCRIGIMIVKGSRHKKFLFPFLPLNSTSLPKLGCPSLMHVWTQPSHEENKSLVSQTRILELAGMFKPSNCYCRNKNWSLFKIISI